jgi:hypothetical protein
MKILKFWGRYIAGSGKKYGAYPGGKKLQIYPT